MHTFKVTVEGRGPFPFDMLRRDRCFPRDESDANAAGAPDGERRRVTVEHQSDTRWWMPNLGRWASFGWAVVSVEVTDPRGKTWAVPAAELQLP